MGKLQVFEILLAGDQSVYKPGDVVQGEAMIVVSKEKGDIRGIQITCVGKAFTNWTESEGSGDDQRTVSFTTNHEYFNQEITLRGSGKDNTTADRITLTAGEHRFPFQFQIPNISLPPPFEGDYGYVRYYVKVTIDRPWKFDHHTQRLFSIFTVKDLNYELNVLTPQSHQVEKTVCCLCCASGPIVLKGLIDKRGYAPGEFIFISLDLNNNSSRRIIVITAKLIQKGNYTAQLTGSDITHDRQSINTVAELKLDGCEAMGSVNHDRVRMLIPPIPPCAYESCPNIKVEYFVQIKGDVAGTPRDAKMDVGVVIGTIPAFQHTLKDPSQNPYAVQPIPGQPEVPPPGQPGYPPPQPGFPQPAPGQQGYAPLGQHGAPPSGQPGFPQSAPGQPGFPQPAPEHQGFSPPGVPPPIGATKPGQQRYPPPGVPQPGQQGLPLLGQPGAPPSEQAGYPLPGGQTGEEGLPPPPIYMAAVGGPQEIKGNRCSFGSVLYAPQYPYYDPDTLYASMGNPQGVSGSSAGGGQLTPTVMQPMSIQQPPNNP